LGNSTGNESSSQSLSVIIDTGCLPLPGAMLKTSLPDELSQSALSVNLPKYLKGFLQVFYCS
jgi:hypothetical protein